MRVWWRNFRFNLGYRIGQFTSAEKHGRCGCGNLIASAGFCEECLEYPEP